MEITDIFNSANSLNELGPSTKETLIQKLTDSRVARVYKRFDISIEDLQDNPSKLMEIVFYLDSFKDKINSYNIHNWIDDFTMRPMIMLELFLKEEFEIFNKTMNDRIIHSLNKM